MEDLTQFNPQLVVRHLSFEGVEEFEGKST
jgi:hypothetical protein